MTRTRDFALRSCMEGNAVDGVPRKTQPVIRVLRDSSRLIELSYLEFLRVFTGGLPSAFAIPSVTCGTAAD